MGQAEPESVLELKLASQRYVVCLSMHDVCAQVMKERVRVLEFMRDYDKLCSG